MTKNNFGNIPNEIIQENIVIYLNPKDLCFLGSVNKNLKNICDSNESWKIHYLNFIPEKWKINEKSVHNYGTNIYKYIDDKNQEILSTISPDSRLYYINSNKLFDIHNIYKQALKSQCKFIECLGRPPIINVNKTTKEGIIRCGCLNYQFPLYNLQQNNNLKRKEMYDIIPDETILTANLENINSKTECYYKIINNWEKYNKSKNLHQLCQNPLHYDFNTLDIPDNFKNYKNFKKQVIKKIFINEKKGKSIDSLYNQRETERKNKDNKIKKLKKQILEEENYYKDRDNNLKKKITKLQNFEKSLDILDNKKCECHLCDFKKGTFIKKNKILSIDKYKSPDCMSKLLRKEFTQSDFNRICLICSCGLPQYTGDENCGRCGLKLLNFDDY